MGGYSPAKRALLGKRLSNNSTLFLMKPINMIWDRLSVVTTKKQGGYQKSMLFIISLVVVCFDSFTPGKLFSGLSRLPQGNSS